MGTALAVGDAGVWVTYARGMNGKAQREFKELCYTVRLTGLSGVISQQLIRSSMASHFMASRRRMQRRTKARRMRSKTLRPRSKPSWRA